MFQNKSIQEQLDAGEVSRRLSSGQTKDQIIQIMAGRVPEEKIKEYIELHFKAIGLTIID